MFASNIQPRRRMREKPKPWKHCGKPVAAHHVRCPECGEKRA